MKVVYLDMCMHQTNTEAQADKEYRREKEANPTIPFPENPHSKHQDNFDGAKICLHSIRFIAPRGTSMNLRHLGLE